MFLLNILLTLVQPVIRPFAEISEEDLEGYLNASTPAPTRKTNLQVQRLYDQWREQKITAFPNRTPPPMLDSMDYVKLSRSLTQFFCELRKMDRSCYKADSIRVYFHAIARSLKDNNPEINVYKDARFHNLKKTVDGLIRTLRQTENPIKKQAQEITPDMEKDLRDRGFLGYDTPKGLLAALLFELGKLFGLRGGKELRSVRRNQLKIENVDSGLVKITFFEDRTKTNQAGLSGSSGSGIRGPHLENPNSPFSVSSLLMEYTSKLPPSADINSTFWYTPLKKPSNNRIWYKDAPIGERTLGKFVTDLMKAAGYQHKRFTNHSLRTTTVNRLIDAGMSDGDIMARTGHRSSTTIAKYRRVNEGNSGASSSALTLASPVSSQPFQPTQEDMDEILKIIESFQDDDFEEDVPIEQTAPILTTSTTEPDQSFNIGLTQLLNPIPLNNAASTTTTTTRCNCNCACHSVEKKDASTETTISFPHGVGFKIETSQIFSGN